MAKDWPFLDIPAGPAALVLECLEASWPEAITLTPGRAGLACQDRAFLVALVGLQDAGWVMCEALLAGSGQEPYALETALTAKGRNELARYRNSG